MSIAVAPVVTSEPRANPLVLNSWKEIAAYLGRGVRTVQRWECDAGLPVHRPKGKDRSAVLALKSEVDEWLRRTDVRRAGSRSDAAAALVELGHELEELADQLVGAVDGVQRLRLQSLAARVHAAVGGLTTTGKRMGNAGAARASQIAQSNSGSMSPQAQNA